MSRRRPTCAARCTGRSPAGGARGFTLLELMLVLAIGAVLLGMATPALRDMIRRIQLDTAASDLFGAIDLARSQAIARGQRVMLAPRDQGGTDWSEGWVVFVDDNGDRQAGPGEEVIASHRPLAAGIVTSFTFTSNSLPYYIAFNGAGRSCSATSTLAARFGTLSLHDDGQIRRIKINMLGRARLCNPERDGPGCSGDQGGG